MPFKERVEKAELKILRILHHRTESTEDEAKYYFNQEKGFKGEKTFDLLTDQLPENQLVLNDLLLNVNNTKFQIDTSIIFQSKVHLFEIKYLKGNYFYEDGKIHMLNSDEISNPLIQSKRSESLFSQLLQKNGFRIPVESHVIFNNPEFTLYQAPKDQPFVYPTQLNYFMKKIAQTPSKLNASHKKLADHLVSLHQVESPYARLRPYKYDQLKKGFLCAVCHSPAVSIEGNLLICSACEARETVDSAVVRSVKELQLLFPDMKLTTKIVQEWCQLIDSRKSIRRIMKRNFKAIGIKNNSYYE